MLVRNWTNTDISKFSLDLSNLDIHYNGKPILIQIPKGCIISHPQIFNNPRLHFLNVSISYNNNEFTKNFINYINTVEKHIISLYKSKKEYKHKKSLKHTSENARSYFNLSIQIYNNDAIISIFDPYKNRQDINYIIPQSSAICLVNPKTIWKNNGSIGINWVLVQAKIFQPIIKLEQCLILDEFEDSPIKHYHHKSEDKEESKENKEESRENKKDENVNSSSNDDDFNEKYAKFIKMRKFGIPIGAIQTELLKYPELSIKVFKKHFGIPEEESPPPRPRPKIVLPVKTNKQQSGTGHTSSAFKPPSVVEIQNVLSKLKPVKK